MLHRIELNGKGVIRVELDDEIVGIAPSRARLVARSGSDITSVPCASRAPRRGPMNRDTGVVAPWICHVPTIGYDTRDAGSPA